MSKGLEALEEIRECDVGYRLEMFKHNCKIIEKELNDYENLKLKHRSMQDAVLEDFKKLKALEIIKNKKVNVKWLFNSVSSEEYNKWYAIPLTQEEYDLLKEVLL